MIDAKYVTTGTPEIARFDFSRVNNLAADKTAARINKASRYIWEIYGDKGTPEAPLTFDMLTKKQKLDFLAAHLENVINDAARTQVYNEQNAIANSNVTAEVENN